MGDNFLIAVLLFVQKEWVELMGHLLYDMCLQGIMVVVFIITVDWIYNYHDSLQAQLIEGVGHYW